MLRRCAAQLRSICGHDPEFVALHKLSLARQDPPGSPFVGIGPRRQTPGPAYGSIETCREWFRSAVILVTFVFPKLSCSFSRTCKPWAERAPAAIGGAGRAGGALRRPPAKPLHPNTHSVSNPIPPPHPPPSPT